MYTMVKVPQYLSLAQAAETFNVSVKSIRTAIQRGKVPAYHPNGRCYLVRADEMMAWIEGARFSPCR